MDNIVPRWEWRTFGDDFGEAKGRFAALSPTKVQNSAEIYLLAPGLVANVKVRDNLLDIKLLDAVDSSGLEQWRPAVKEPFPLKKTVVDQVRAALGLGAGTLAQGGVTLAELIALPEPVRVVNVAKTRTRFHAHGCLLERTDVVAGGKKVCTVAIEDADPAKVIAAVQVMGLSQYPNINYPRGLKQLVGMSP